MDDVILQPTSEEIVEADTGKTESTYIESHGVLKDFFEIDNLGAVEGEKLREVWDYLRQEYPKQPLQERFHQLRSLESRIGQPKLGQTRLGKLHSYIRAQQMVKQAEKWRDGIISK